MSNGHGGGSDEGVSPVRLRPYETRGGVVITTTFEQMKARLTRAHIEPALGSNRQNRAYCAKGGDFVEVGTLTQRVQTSQEAQEVVRLIVEEGLSPIAIAVEYQEFSAYIVNHFHALLAMYKESERIRLEVETVARMNKD